MRYARWGEQLHHPTRFWCETTEQANPEYPLVYLWRNRSAGAPTEYLMLGAMKIHLELRLAAFVSWKPLFKTQCRIPQNKSYSLNVIYFFSKTDFIK